MLDQHFEEEDSYAPSAETIAVGIDLGTTNTVVAYSDKDGPTVVADEAGRYLHGSVVAFLPNGRTKIGQKARERRLIDPKNTISSAKRIIGQPFSSPKLQSTIKHFTYEVLEGANQEPIIRTRAGDLSVPQVSGLVVQYAKAITEIITERTVSHCVVTVPANFNDAQREATRRAAKVAGLQVLRILNEPTAAALAYGHGRSLNKRIAVFDLGGGTFDLSVLSIRRGLYEVLATGGDPFLGGDDMDQALADELGERFLREHRIDPRTHYESLNKLMIAAEQIKIYLSSHDEAPVQLHDIDHGLDGRELGLETVVTRAEFEALIEPIVDCAIESAQNVLLEADILPEHIDEVLLVGGTTLVPLVRRRVAKLFGRMPQSDIDPMQVVALGAALHAQALHAPETIAEREVEAGAAPGATAGQESPIDLLMDVTSHSVGLATTGGYAEVLLEKNTQIPAEVSRFFSTARDNQESVVLKVCQGSDPRFEKNEALGELRLAGLRPGPRGQVRIEVGFLIDADGLLQVTAKDQDTGAQTDAVLSLFGLNDNEPVELIDPKMIQLTD